MLFNSCLDALAHSVTEMVNFSFLSSNVLKFDKLLLSFKWQQFCNEKARTWFGLYGFPSYPLSSVYFQRSSILRRKKKKRSRFVIGVKAPFRWTTIVSFLTMLSPRLSVGELICYGESIWMCRPKRSAIWPGTRAMKLGGLGSFSSFCKAVCTAASIEKFVNSSIDPETHNYALFEAIL